MVVRGERERRDRMVGRQLGGLPVPEPLVEEKAGQREERKRGGGGHARS